ncbi:ArnT family glycosyltransferase [Tritonibacter horizontis]|uniref:Glycosyltransferase RgtA/B/C/D-like domain-containing protein n=1 Tax=Tritonibacter horizontis TaxID=1768241 RepID=A0A132BVS4_9RHOB|nr:glycosyltransferase family 39 protein [Tritonibacter horizontis]KUP92394.1 hypothetical protein TRIHO_26980 [Tritonibacter horizontis]
MQKSVPQPKAFDLSTVGVGLIAAVTALRLTLLWASDADLFFDESQYWLWGQNLDFGYYSKPPLIGWVIRLVTDMSGSDSVVWIRAAAPLCHGAAALALMAAARRLTDAEAALAVGLAYVSLPLIAVGSALISTDTILLPFWCAALLLWLRQLEAPNLRDAAVMGLCLGLGMLAKYAAAYFLLGAGIAALAVPASRLPLRHLALTAVVFAAVIAPNVVWNMAHDFATVSHTADNVDWIRQEAAPRLHFAALAEFLLSQGVVMGPVLFIGFIWAGWHAARHDDPRARWLLCMSLPILALVCAQALLSKAYANWAAMTYPAALLLGVPFLLHRARRLLWVGLGINLCLSLAVACAATQVTQWSIGDRLVLKRYTGRDRAVQEVVDLARDAQLAAIVADSRPVLADLFYYGRDAGLALYAVPHPAKSPHYYAERFPLPAKFEGDVLYVGRAAPCGQADALGPVGQGPGAYADRGLHGFRVPATCWELSR